MMALREFKVIPVHKEFKAIQVRLERKEQTAQME
jgi:hypothetical protein